MNKLSNSSCRYVLVTTALRRAIEEGLYGIGVALPTEAELCEQFNVSRHTVREALRQLRNMGLVNSRQGCGTVVTNNTISAHYIQSLDSLEDFMEFLRQAKGKILSSEITQMPNEIAKISGLPFPSQRLWLNLEIIRYWGEKKTPTLLSSVYIDAKYSDIKKNYDLTLPLSTALEQKYGVVPELIEQDIQAIVLNKHQSQILKTKPNSPALQTIRRCCTNKGEILVVSCNTAPADRYTYSTKMRITAKN